MITLEDLKAYLTEEEFKNFSSNLNDFEGSHQYNGTAHEFIFHAFPWAKMSLPVLEPMERFKYWSDVMCKVKALEDAEWKQVTPMGKVNSGFNVVNE